MSLQNSWYSSGGTSTQPTSHNTTQHNHNPFDSENQNPKCQKTLSDKNIKERAERFQEEKQRKILSSNL